MSLQLIQEPTNYNAAYTRLLYVVSGSIYTDQPQFQYVCDVYSGSNLLKRMTQGINPAGTATFDVARILQGELSVDYNWKTSSVTEMYSSSKTFRVKLGEQFATSISSSVVVYPDQTNDPITVNQSIVEPNAGTYNFTPTKQVLSNMPTTMSMQSDDYGTVSIYNDQGTYISQSFYSASVGSYVKVDEKNYTKGAGAYFNVVPISSSANYWNYVDVSISSSYGTENYRYEASDETHREKTRFAFVNKLGAWDYYNNYNPVRQAIEVKREQYTAARVDYSSRLSTYDISRRGRTDYHNSTDDVFTVDTDLLDKTNANWLEELIESPEVYIQRNGEFIPIVITDSSYTSNTNQARQKQFKYTINFKPSNQPFGTWIPEYVQCPKQIEPTIPVLSTSSPQGVTGYSMTMVGSIDSTGDPNTIVERGFVYSTSSATPTLSNNKTFTGSPPFTTGGYSINPGVNFLPDSTVYYRAYASSSTGAYYGNVISQQTLQAFDPTLSGEISPYFWYDFADRSTITNIGGNFGICDGITSKGTNTGSLERGPTTELKYSSSNWEGFSAGPEAAMFNINAASNGKNSTIARAYGTGDYTTDTVFNTGSQITTLTITNFDNSVATNTSGAQPLISIKQPNGTAGPEELNLYGFGLSGAFPTGSNETNTFISTDTTNFRSASYLEYESPNIGNINERDNVIYSYNGATTPSSNQLETRYMVYNSGSDNGFKVGREPISQSSQTFTTSSVVLTDAEPIPIGAEGLAIGSRATKETSVGTWTTEPYSFRVSQVLVYDAILTDDQIQRVIDNYKESVSFGNLVNSITN
jgi:hypothetical protein